MNRARTDTSNTSLLATKFALPHVRPDLVPRPHLIERLNRGLSGRVTLVSAPAGFGKTTLLGQWIKQTQHRVAWVSLDEGDDDQTRFWIYVIAALQRIEPGLGADALAMLYAPQAARVPIESVLTSLINDIDASATNDKIVLILDDYHLIIKGPTLDALEYFVDHQPQRLHVILGSRADPALPLARLRARDHLSELRAGDLRFATAEAGQFFNEMMGLALSTDQISALERSSEGWIAGMKLAGLSLQGRSDVSDFIINFTGSNRYILDYLVEEVLRRQPEATQSFLLHTSILDRLTAPLCDALTLRADGQATLESLERANLFITALDDERRWYRYHHLFAEFLRHHLRRDRADLIPVLQRRASEWYERNGLMAPAIDFALSSNDFERAANLIESVGRKMVISGDIPRLLGWLDALPPELLRARSYLRLLSAWALVLCGEMDIAEARLRELEAEQARVKDASALGSIAAVRAQIACYRQDSALTLELSHQALELLEAKRLPERGSVLLQMGAAFGMEGNFAEACRAFSDALAGDREAGNNIVTIFALGRLVGVQAAQGRLREAASFYERAIRSAIGPSGSLLPYASMACLGMATVLYEWDDLDAAERHAKMGVEFGQKWGRLNHVALGQIQLAQLAIARADWEKAREELDSASRLADEHDFPDVASQAAACRLRLMIRCGTTEAANKWTQERGLRPEDNPDFVREPEYIALARLTIHEAATSRDSTQMAQVVGLLDRMCHRAEVGGRIGNVIEMLAIRSLAIHSMGDSDKATISLERALALAEPEGYIRTFVDLGQMMVSLLRHAASRGIAPRYVATLLTAFKRDVSGGQIDEDGNERDSSSTVIISPLIESLSERELEVLRLVAGGLSNQQIADRLILAVGTVKRHLNNIFGKLGVGSRIQAVSRARDLGLL